MRVLHCLYDIIELCSSCIGTSTLIQENDDPPTPVSMSRTPILSWMAENTSAYTIDWMFAYLLMFYNNWCKCVLCFASKRSQSNHPPMLRPHPPSKSLELKHRYNYVALNKVCPNNSADYEFLKRILYSRWQMTDDRCTAEDDTCQMTDDQWEIRDHH